MAAVTGAPDKHHPVAGILWMLGAACCFAASLTLVKALQEDGMAPFQAVLFRQIFGLVIFISLSSMYCCHCAACSSHSVQRVILVLSLGDKRMLRSQHLAPLESIRL